MNPDQNAPIGYQRACTWDERVEMGGKDYEAARYMYNKELLSFYTLLQLIPH